MNLFQQLCKKHNIDFYDADIDPSFTKDMGKDHWTNYSSSCFDEIRLGFYDDKDIKNISFFHEFGHCRVPKVWSKYTFDYFAKSYMNRFYDEIYAWRYAILFTKKLNIDFKKETIKWARGELATYFNQCAWASDNRIKITQEMENEMYKLALLI